MNEIERIKFVEMMPPISANNGDFSGNTYVDTQGWEHLRVLFVCGALAAAVGSTAEGTAPKVEECDTLDGSYADVTSAALADAIATGEANTMFAIDVNLTKSHKRYMRVNVPHAGNGACVVGIVGILSRKSSGVFAGGASESGLTEKISA